MQVMKIDGTNETFLIIYNLTMTRPSTACFRPRKDGGMLIDFIRFILHYNLKYFRNSDWVKRVYPPDIINNKDKLYNRPEYNPFK